MHPHSTFTSTARRVACAVALALPLAVPAQGVRTSPVDETLVERAARAGDVRRVILPIATIKRTEVRTPVELELVFTTRSGDYLVDVRVQIHDEAGTRVLDTVSDTAFLSVAVPPGQYTVHVTFGQGSQSRTVRLDGSRPVTAQFLWGPPAMGGIEAGPALA